MARKTLPPTTDHPAYAAMCAVAQALGWPERFARDLTHWDREELTHWHPAKPFAWVVGANGTHIVWTDRTADERRRNPTGLLCEAAQEAVCSLDGRARWFWWDGARLIASCLEDSTDRLVDFDEQARRGGIDTRTGALKTAAA